MIRFLLLVAFCAITTHASSQIVVFPDANFKNACVNYAIVDFDGDGIPEADVDTNDDGEIQVSEALAVERMYPRGTGIQSMVGIEEFANLQILNCSMNIMTELDLSQNTELTVLSCFFNNLTLLNVTQNSNLVELNCDLNELSTLDMTGNPLLERLTCPENNLTTLDLSQNPALVTLTADQNSLTALDISQNPALEFLSFDNNAITSIDFSGNPNLSVVDVFNNQLTHLDLSQNPSLTKLWCYNNNLQSLSIKNGENTSLTILRAEDNSSLNCVEVDDVLYAENQASWVIDVATTYSEDCILSLTNFQFETIKVYPNPAYDEVNVAISEANQITSLRLFNQFGKELIIPSSLTEPISLSNLSQGVYFLSVETENGTEIKKILKQ